MKISKWTKDHKVNKYNVNKYLKSILLKSRKIKYLQIYLIIYFKTILSLSDRFLKLMNLLISNKFLSLRIKWMNKVSKYRMI